jgi:hypothetical protein
VSKVVQQSLNEDILQLIARQQEDRIIEVLKSSSLDQINGVEDSTWEQMMPVLTLWLMKKNSEHQTMAYSIAYHMMQRCPQVFTRPSVSSYVKRVTRICDDQVRSGQDFSHLGGLSYQEMTNLNHFLLSTLL